MATKQKKFFKEISVFPFFKTQLQNRFAGAIIAAVYFVVILYIGIKYHVVGDYHVETDFFQVYVPAAKDVLKGIWQIDDFRGPGYPAVLSLFGALFNNYFTAGIILSAFTSSLTLFFIFETIKKLFRVDVAFIVVVLTAVNKTFVQYSYTAGTDMTFNMFVAASLYFLFRSDERKRLNIALVSLFSAAAYLTRFNGIFVLAAVPAIILIDIFSLKLKDRIFTSVIFIGLFFLFILPWGLYVLGEKGSFFFNRNYLNIAYEMFAKGRIGWDQYWNVEASKYNSLLQVIMADPSLFVSTLFKNLYEHFLSDMELLVGWGTAICFGAGIIGMWKERPNKKQLSYFAFGGFFFVVLLTVFYGERFSLFLIPIYTTIGVSALAWQRWRAVSFYNGFFIALILVVWSFSTSYNFNKENIDSGPKEIVSIANWFNTNVKDADETKIIVCRKPHIAFYINKKMVYFPYVNSWQELEIETKKINASYLFYGIFEANMRPEFQQLLDPRQSPPWLEPVTYTANPPSVLYRVKYN